MKISLLLIICIGSVAGAVCSEVVCTKCDRMLVGHIYGHTGRGTAARIFLCRGVNQF